jgi:3-deoxy-manno-octulosonate cytidylyltransferase (CMP-KDO synthetase)
MVVRVYERVRATRTLADVIVATDDVRICRVVEAHGGTCAMTRADHRSGTDRLAEVAASLTADVVINVQGDEPLVEPAMIEAAIAPFADDPSLEMSTLCSPLRSAEEFADPNVVKVVVARDGHALYFSRAPVPYPRGRVGRAVGVPACAFKHVGLYAYRRTTLLRLAALPPTPLEQIESLEQLRALEHGIRIRVVETPYESIGVDTPDDADRVRALLAPLPAGHHAES